MFLTVHKRRFLVSQYTAKVSLNYMKLILIDQAAKAFTLLNYELHYFRND